MCLNVRRFPPPSSRIYEQRYIGAETREEGGTRCQRALAAEWDRGAEKIGQQEVAETASGCPKRWCWSKRRTGGTEDSLPCSWVEEGWLPSERERRSRPVRLEAEACCHPPCLGRSRERGTRCRLPSTGGAIAGRQEAEGASGRPPKRSSTIAWHREWTAQLVEDRAAVCPGTGPRFFFFFNNQINKHNRKAAAPHGRLPQTKHKLKSRPGPLSSSNVVTPPFIPSGAPPWDSRPVSGAGVVHYHSLHRPRSVPTALGPAPLVTITFCII